MTARLDRPQASARTATTDSVGTPPPARRRAGRRGAAAVEFAVVAVLLFVLVLGIVEVGRAMMVLEMLGNAARNGARVGTLPGSTTQRVSDEVSNTLTSTGVAVADAADIKVNGSASTAGTDLVSTAVSGDTISVTVRVQYAQVTWLPTTLFMGDRTLSSTAVMRHE
jgi:Flp pilus assembly protein TadG